MGLRFRKSIKICDGLKLNFGKTGASVTVGSGAVKKTYNTNGNITTTVGVPGTGIYWTETERRNSCEHSQQHNTQIAEALKNNYSVSSVVDDFFAETRTPTEVPVSSIRSVQQHNAVATAEPTSNNRHYLSAANIKSIYAYCDDPIEWTELISGASADDLLMDYQKYDYCRSIATKILAGDTDTYLNAIEVLRPVDDLLLYGGEFEFGTDKPSYIEVEFSAKPENMLSNGTRDAFLEEFICAVSVRVARDLMALLPVVKVLVHTTIDNRTVLSVLFTKGVMSKINFKNSPASEIVNNFENYRVNSFDMPYSAKRVSI